jgi:DNA topoisomerase-1
VTTLRKRHVTVERNTIRFSFAGKGRAQVRRVLADADLADAVRTLVGIPGGRRLFRYRNGDVLANLTGRTLNDYVHEYLGDDFTAKDFRTWGGTLTAAIGLAERGVPESEAEAKRCVAAVMRSVGEKLGNTPAVARASYVSPAVIEQYLDGRTIESFRPRRLRVVGAHDAMLTPEEEALVSLLRSWRIRRAREAA